MPRNVTIIKEIRNRILFLMVSGMIRLLRSLRREPAVEITRTIGRIAFYVAVKERRRAVRHLFMAFGGEKAPHDIYRLAKRVFLHLGTAAADAVRIPNLILEGMEKIITVEGWDRIQRHATQQRGFIGATAHFGNWELLAAWVARQGYPVRVVGAPALDARFDEMILRNRRLGGYTPLSRGKDTRELVRSIREGCSLGILIDQDTKVEGVFVKFFGRWAHTAVGPVILARKYGMPILPMFIRMKEDRSYHIEIQAPIDLETTGDPHRDLIVNTQKCSDRCEDVIRRHPEQWVWMHRRWRKQPPPGYAGPLEPLTR